MPYPESSTQLTPRSARDGNHRRGQEDRLERDGEAAGRTVPSAEARVDGDQLVGSPNGRYRKDRAGPSQAECPTDEKAAANAPYTAEAATTVENPTPSWAPNPSP